MFPCDKETYPSPIPTWIWPEYLSPIIIFALYMAIANQVSIKREDDERTFYEALIESQYYPIIQK